MDSAEFRFWAHQVADQMADYYEHIEDYPVKSQVKPGEIRSKLPQSPPAKGEMMGEILSDFSKHIMPGITHWQSPNFFAYFPANASFPSILAEMITASLGAQCMIWETSPAAAELEETVMDWMKAMTGLPQSWSGVIQDTASTSTLVALLTAREKNSNFGINSHGFQGEKVFRVYCSTETHSSVEKAVRIAGIGSQNLVKVQADNLYRLDPTLLRQAIENDLAAGFVPLMVVATLGTTGCTAIDPLAPVGEICRQYNIWLHIDGAYGGSALLLPEYRYLIEGIQLADSLVMNPHKWMFTNFDCSAYFVKDRESLIRTFEILPEYLKTGTRGFVNDYRDWGIQLGRRFRALKLWFVIRSFGTDGLQARLREHIASARWFESQLVENEYFEILAPVNFSVVCFRLKPKNVSDEESLNRMNSELLALLNATGKLYLTHTKLNGRFTLRLSVAGTLTSQQHVENAWNLIRQMAEKMLYENSLSD